MDGLINTLHQKGRLVFVLFFFFLISISNVHAATYYVGSAPDCDDADGSGTSTKTPFCSIVVAVNSALPGDIVQLLPGTHTGIFNVDNFRSGLRNLPITIRGSGVNNTFVQGQCQEHPCSASLWFPGRRSPFKVRRKSDLIFEQFTIRDYARAGIEIEDSDRITIRNMGFYSLGGTAVLAQGVRDFNLINTDSNYVNLGSLGNVIDPETGYWAYWKGQEAISVKVLKEGESGVRSDKVLILNNRVRNSVHEGITTGGASNVLVLNNDVKQTCGNMYYALEGNDITFGLNRGTNAGYIRVPPTINIQTFFRARGVPVPATAPTGIVHCYSEFAESPYHIRPQGSAISIGACDLGNSYETMQIENVYIAKNVFYNIPNGGFSAFDHCRSRRGVQGIMRNIYVTHNTFSRVDYDQSTTLRPVWFSPGTRNAHFSNNIISDSERGIGVEQSVRSEVFIYNNLFHQVQGGISGMAEAVGDPKFVDPDGGNFDIQPGSAAIDVGTTARHPRLAFPYCQGSPDAGAFEYCP